MPKPFSKKKSCATILTHNWEDKGVHTVSKGICPKVNVIARLEYELTYYDLTITPRGHPLSNVVSWGTSIIIIIIIIIILFYSYFYFST